MIPQTLVIKIVAALVFLGAIFGAGCQVQKKMDAGKIERLKNVNGVLHANNSELTMSIRKQNEAYDKLGEVHAQRVASLHAAHKEALEEFIRDGRKSREKIDRETADLRKRLAELSVAEACHEAWKELARE